MVLLVSTASATLGLALLAASSGPFDHAFAAQRGAEVALSANPARVTAAELAATGHVPVSPRRPARSRRRRCRLSSAGSRSVS